MKRRWPIWICFLLPLAWAVIVVGSCSNNQAAATADSSARSPFLNLNDSVGYVGIETCRGCHSDKHSTFTHTGMGQSFGLATREKSAARFQQKAVYDAKRNFYYWPYWESDSLRILEFRLQGRDTVYKRIETIRYIIGSGQHTNSHFWVDGNTLYQAPLTYYTQEGKWDLPPGYETHNTRFQRKIDLECMSCHNAMPHVKKGSVNAFDRLPMGIDCERCHGPGELHVAQKKAGILVDTRKQADYSIVNPRRLPWSLQVDICQRCHLQGNNVLKPGKNFDDFRPGMKLSDVFEVYMPRYENSDYFVMAGHAERLAMSACFIKSNQGIETEAYNPGTHLTCINCHNPHVSVKQTRLDSFNQQCQQCHQAGSSRSSLHRCLLSPAEQKRNPKGCVSCHMPASDTRDIPHVTVHDHRIQRPQSKSQALVSGRALDLYAVNNPNPSPAMLAKAYVSWFEKFDPQEFWLQKADSLMRAYPEQMSLELRIQLDYMRHDDRSLIQRAQGLELGQTDAWTAYRMAKAWDRSQNLDKALEAYKRAYESLPLYSDFGAEYANALIRAKRLNEAQTVLSTLLREQPKNEWLWLNQGLLASLQGRSSEAITAWNRLLELNPDHLEGHLYLSEWYERLGKTGAALMHAETAFRAHSNSQEAEKRVVRLRSLNP